MSDFNTNTKINREPFVFENNGNQLYGMIHHPETHDQQKPAILLLSAGLKNRIGYGRLYVTLADFLASHGYPVLRYDYHGCGDSDGHLALTGSYHETHANINGLIQTGMFVDDTMEAIKALKENTNYRKFVACGLCGGSVTSLQASTLTKDIITIIMINTPLTIDSDIVREQTKDSMNLWMSKFLYKSYLNKIFKPKAWLRFFTFKSNYKSIFQVFRTKINLEPGAKSTNSKAPEGNVFNFNYDLLNKFTSYYDSGRNSYFILAENDPVTLDFETYFQNDIGKNLLEKYKKQWKKIVIKESNHSFTNAEWRDQLFNEVLISIKKEMK